MSGAILNRAGVVTAEKLAGQKNKQLTEKSVGEQTS